MITRLFNNPYQTGDAPGLQKLPEDAVSPLPLICQPLPLALEVSGSNRVPQGLRRRPAPVQAEMSSKPRLAENFELAAERPVPDYGSSGSDHDPSSVSLFAMVHEFMENEGTGSQQSYPADAHGCLDSSKDRPKVNGSAEIAQAIQSLAACSDSCEEALLRDTQEVLDSINVEALHMCDGGRPATVTHSCLKRMVMSRLQKKGYNAAVCKTKWDHLCGIPAGDYEYLDVHVVPDGARPERLLVDIDFQSQFVIARPTDEFMMIWKLLPPVFVGRAERLKRVVYIMSEATKHSLRVKGLHLPPWRKPAYMIAKWFSSYKRTLNVSSSRPCRGGDCQHLNALGFAVRGGGLDAKYTNDLERVYHDTGSTFLVRQDKEMVSPQREGGEITVISTDWQLPPVAPRRMVLRKQGTVTGLSSLLLQSPPSACKEVTVQAA